jgi:hypothetical protein
MRSAVRNLTRNPGAAHAEQIYADTLSPLSVGDDGGQSTGAGGVYMRFERKVSVEDNNAPIR